MRANRSSRAASRSMSRKPWNFSAGRSVEMDRGPGLVKDSRDGIRMGSRVPRWAAGHRHERRR
jgi:hypothetical protein